MLGQALHIAILETQRELRRNSLWAFDIVKVNWFAPQLKKQPYYS